MEVSGLEEARKATGGERAGSSPLDNRKNNRGGEGVGGGGGSNNREGNSKESSSRICILLASKNARNLHVEN